MIRYVKELSQENRTQILSGEAAAKPYRMNQNTPCDYCAFRPACGFDPGIPGFSYNEIRKADHDKLWKRIMEGEERGNSLDQ